LDDTPVNVSDTGVEEIIISKEGDFCVGSGWENICEDVEQ